MAVTAAERKELTKLFVANFDKDGKPLPDADGKAFKRVDELLAKVGPDEDTRAAPAKIKNHKLSLEGQALVEQKAEYLGCEARNLGTEEKPNMVIREYFYRQGPQGRECVMVQQGKVIGIGRTLAASALNRISQ
jgi:hypothetical protein